jgi:hypothetical protein
MDSVSWMVADPSIIGGSHNPGADMPHEGKSFW